MPQWTSCNAVLNIHYVMFAHNVQVYILTQGGHVLKVTPQVAALGAESVVYNCLFQLNLIVHYMKTIK